MVELVITRATWIPGDAAHELYKIEYLVLADQLSNGSCCRPINWNQMSGTHGAVTMRNLEEAHRLLDTFASVGARHFDVTFFDLDRVERTASTILVNQ